MTELRSINEVLVALHEEFPDVTVSKIRFLESQGLLTPARSASGNRRFADADVGRLRWILHRQRDGDLAMAEIKAQLESDTSPSDSELATNWSAATPAPDMGGEFVSAELRDLDFDNVDDDEVVVVFEAAAEEDTGAHPLVRIPPSAASVEVAKLSQQESGDRDPGPAAPKTKNDESAEGAGETAQSDGAVSDGAGRKEQSGSAVDAQASDSTNTPDDKVLAETKELQEPSVVDQPVAKSTSDAGVTAKSEGQKASKRDKAAHGPVASGASGASGGKASSTGPKPRGNARQRRKAERKARFAREAAEAKAAAEAKLASAASDSPPASTSQDKPAAVSAAVAGPKVEAQASSRAERADTESAQPAGPGKVEDRAPSDRTQPAQVSKPSPKLTAKPVGRSAAQKETVRSGEPPKTNAVSEDSVATAPSVDAGAEAEDSEAAKLDPAPDKQDRTSKDRSESVGDATEGTKVIDLRDEATQAGDGLHSGTTESNRDPRTARPAPIPPRAPSRRPANAGDGRTGTRRDEHSADSVVAPVSPAADSQGRPVLEVVEPTSPRAAVPALPAFDVNDFDISPTSVSLTREELMVAAQLDEAQVADLEKYGMISGRSVGATTFYDDDALTIARVASRFASHGIEARHLRTYKVAAEREAGLFEQAVMPLVRRPDAGDAGRNKLAELGALGEAMRGASLRQALRPYLQKD